MASGTKYNLDTCGEWQRASSPNLFRFPSDLKLIDLSSRLAKFEPVQEWNCGVVCIAKIKKFDGKWMLNVRAYDIPEERDAFVADFFDLSLTYNLVDVDPKQAFLYVKKSEDGSTNITEEVMDTVLKAVNKPIVTLSDELASGGWSVT